MAKSRKDAVRAARQMLQATLVDGKVDEDRARKYVRRISEAKPRGYLAILENYLRLLRLEVAKRHATVESAAPLSPDLRSSVEQDLRRKYGDDLKAAFEVDDTLVGGMRVRVGSDVWDGSVKGRLERLADHFA